MISDFKNSKHKEIHFDENISLKDTKSRVVVKPCKCDLCVKPYKCDLCDYKSAWKQAFQRHMSDMLLNASKLKLLTLVFTRRQITRLQGEHQTTARMNVMIVKFRSRTV